MELVGGTVLGGETLCLTIDGDGGLGIERLGPVDAARRSCRRPPWLLFGDDDERPRGFGGRLDSGFGGVRPSELSLRTLSGGLPMSICVLPLSSWGPNGDDVRIWAAIRPGSIALALP